MADRRHVVVAGAGVAGLTAALTLARAGYRVSLLEQAAQLSETGAGIQLAPNATGVLIALGLRERLAPCVLVPEAIRVLAGGSGREIVRIPLGEQLERRYGAPYWVIHRADLQAALAAAATAEPDIALWLKAHVEDFTAHAQGVTVQAMRDGRVIDERGLALIGADGVWSTVATRIRDRPEPIFAHRTAWRALIPATQVPADLRVPAVHLWLGSGAHLVHYPVRGGRLINIVAIVHGEWRETGWSAPGARAEIIDHFSWWCAAARALIATPEQWLKWALYHRRDTFHDGSGPVTLIGDAAHPMLPFLAQGAAMAIEDAATLADMLHRYGDDPVDALRGYEGARHRRVAHAQSASQHQGAIYGLHGLQAVLRNLGMRAMGGERLLDRQHWLYSWQLPQLLRNSPL